MREIKQRLAAGIRRILAADGIDCAEEAILFEKPKQAEHGDLSTNVAMVLARQRKRNPREIAQRIADGLAADPDIGASVSIAGPGFINILLSGEHRTRGLESVLEAGEAYGSSLAHAGKRANVEWVSANPTGPLHAGHGRQVCLGATLCALLERVGWTVTREYYFNNAGNQMQQLARSVRARYLEVLGETPDPDEIQYAGEYIIAIARDIVAECGDARRDAPLDFFRERGETWCFASIRKTLERLDVRHDTFFNEDSLYRSGAIAALIDELKAKDLVYESDGALWLRTSQLGADKDRVVVKSTGEPTYRLPDIAYHRAKIGRNDDRIIDIFGADHIATIPDVLSTLRALGVRTDHVDVMIHQMVSFVNEGEKQRMSKREGNVYSLDDLIDDVGKDAVRYFFVMRSAGAHLDFDLQLAVEQNDTNPVYYLQYAHARIASILRFAAAEGLGDCSGPDLSALDHPSENTLITSLMEYPELVEHCAASYEPQQLCTYLQRVAAEFHRFYHDCRVVTDDRRRSLARLALCRAVKLVLNNGMEILGVTAPETM